ncbi:MAG: flagellar motor switch protein FliG [Pirellulaceae bacterium]
MPNVRSAAILLMSLPEEEATLLLSMLPPKQIESVTIEIARVGILSGEEQQKVIMEFADANPNELSGEVGSLELARTLVWKSMGSKAEKTWDNVQHSIEALPFGFLKNVDPQNLVTFVVDEHPQTIALILSHLPTNYGAEVIAHLEPDRQIQVVQRIAQMGQTNPDVLDFVEKGLSSRMSSIVGQSFNQAGGVKSVAAILNVTERSVERSILDALANDEPALVDDIRRLMFVFEDILKLQDKDIQQLLKNVETNQWAMALKGCSEELRDKVLGNMSKRAADMLVEEMEFLGSVKLSDVEGIQQQVVDVVRMLEEQGTVTVSSGPSEDEYIA